MESALSFLLLLLTPVPSVEPKEEPPKPPPQLPAETNWGRVTVRGKRVEIRGNVSWEAEGRYLKPGVVYLEWICLPSGNRAVSIYRYDKNTKQWPGLWGWEGEVWVDAAGNLDGSISSDHLRKEVPLER